MSNIIVDSIITGVIDNLTNVNLCHNVFVEDEHNNTDNDTIDIVEEDDVVVIYETNEPSDHTDRSQDS